MWNSCYIVSIRRKQEFKSYFLFSYTFCFSIYVVWPIFSRAFCSPWDLFGTINLFAIIFFRGNFWYCLISVLNLPIYFYIVWCIFAKDIGNKFFINPKDRIPRAYPWVFSAPGMGIIAWQRKPAMKFKIATLSLRQECLSRGRI